MNGSYSRHSLLLSTLKVGAGALALFAGALLLVEIQSRLRTPAGAGVLCRMGDVTTVQADNVRTALLTDGTIQLENSEGVRAYYHPSNGEFCVIIPAGLGTIPS